MKIQDKFIVLKDRFWSEKEKDWISYPDPEIVGIFNKKTDAEKLAHALSVKNENDAYVVFVKVVITKL